MINFDKIWNEKCSKYSKEQISIFPSVKRIIVIGDIHGDYNMLIELLKLAKVINNEENWIGGETYVVQVGDQIDKCRPKIGSTCENDIVENDEDNDYKILLYLTKLHNQALKTKGAVISLLGNHEIMNVEGDLSYVSRAGLGYNKESNFYNFKSKEDRINRFSVGNEISNFLACTRQVAVIIGSNLFAHAGIVSEIAEKYDIKSINQIMTLYLLNKLNNKEYIYDNKYNKKHYLDKKIYNDIFLNDQISPLWNRIYGHIGYNTNNNNNNVNYFTKKYDKTVNNACNKNLDILNKYYQVDKIFIGHTPMIQKGITHICDGQIWLTDYGSSNAFNNFKEKTHLKQAQVLEILNDGQQINILKSSSLNRSNYYIEKYYYN
jgi:hypothetical protein